MSNLVGHGSPPRVNKGAVLRWQYRLGEILELGLEVAPLAPGPGESTPQPALIGSTDPQLRRNTSDTLEARALGRWEWEGGRTY